MTCIDFVSCADYHLIQNNILIEKHEISGSIPIILSCSLNTIFYLKVEHDNYQIIVQEL